MIRRTEIFVYFRFVGYTEQYENDRKRESLGRVLKMNKINAPLKQFHFLISL